MNEDISDELEDLIARSSPSRRSRTDPLTPRAIAELHALVSEAERLPARKRRRVPRLAGLTAAAAVIVVAVMVGGAGLLTGGGAASAAAATLQDAASNVPGTTSQPGSGQYTVVDVTQILAVTISDFTTGTEAAESYLVQRREETYIPADPTGEWTHAVYPESVYKTFGLRSEELAAEFVPQNPHVRWSSAVGGRFNTADSSSLAAQAELPRDPQRLLDFAYQATAGQGNTKNGEAFVYFADRLRVGITDPELLSAVYRAIALIPGIVIADPAVDLDGRTGVSFTIPADGVIRREVILDPDTGEFIGERQTLLEPSAGMPAGTPLQASVVQTRVVDFIPPQD